MSQDVTQSKLLKSCDVCKTRKVKCSGHPGPCKTCVRRKTRCQFSPQKTSRRPKTTILSSSVGPNSEQIHRGGQINDTQTESSNPIKPIPELYLDRIVMQAGDPESCSSDKPFSVKRTGLFVGTNSVTFFSETRLQRISHQLRNDKVRQLIQRISAFVTSRLRASDTVSARSLKQSREISHANFIDLAEAKCHVDAYFQHAHAVYSFLDRKSFESIAFGPGLFQTLENNKAWSALYYSILAIGCQAGGGGSFEPRKGRSWDLFAKSLALFPDLIVIPDSLAVLQAMAAMAIYAQGISCLPVEHVILTEAARRAHNLGNANLPEASIVSYQRVFWLVYCLEKISSFHFGRNSAFIDHDIVLPVPVVTETPIEGFEWFLTLVKYARLLSRAMSYIFSGGVLGNPTTYFLAAIDQLSDELESWRMSIPEDIRPGKNPRSRSQHGLPMKSITVWLCYLFNNLRLSLARSTLHLAADAKDAVSATKQWECAAIMLDASRSTLELTPFLDVEPYMPILVIGLVPLVSHFVLFDIVINNPQHHETRSNLALLDMGGGYFSRLEYASGGHLPGSLIAEFSHIARDYVNSFDPQSSQPLGSRQKTLSSSHWPDEQNLGLRSPEQSCSGNDAYLGSADGPTHVTSTEVSLDAVGSTFPALDTLQFPIVDAFLQDGNLLGTDVMGIFNAVIPGIDPIFFGQLSEETFPPPSS